MTEAARAAAREATRQVIGQVTGNTQATDMVMGVMLESFVSGVALDEVATNAKALLKESIGYNISESELDVHAMDFAKDFMDLYDLKHKNETRYLSHEPGVIEDLGGEDQVEGDLDDNISYVEDETDVESDAGSRRDDDDLVLFEEESEYMSPAVEIDENDTWEPEGDNPLHQEMMFGCVVRNIDLNTSEFNTTGVQKAIQKEMNELQSPHLDTPPTFRLDEVMEYEDAIRMWPDCLVMGSKMLVGEKFHEMGLPEDEKIYKGRLVAQGNYVRDSEGYRTIERVEHDEPIQMDESKSLMAYGLTKQNPAIKHGDVTKAFPKSRLQGRKVVIRLDKKLRPPEWAQLYRDPVLPLGATLYGTTRADKDWSDKRHKEMINAGWKEEVRRKIYSKEFDTIHGYKEIVYAGVYVDDTLLAGDGEPTDKAYKELDTVLGFSESDPKKADLSVYLGVNATPIQRVILDGHRCNMLFLHQAPLARAVVQRYKEETGYRMLPKVSTPGFPHSEMPDKNEDEIPGVMAKTAPKHIGGLQYLLRGTREDFGHSVGVMCRHFKSWSAFDDRRLHRAMSYLEHTLDMGVALIYDLDGGEDELDNYIDSDHGGDRRTGRSTSSVHAELKDQGYTLIPLARLSKVQRVAAASTGEAEYTAMVEGVKKIALPLQILLEDIFKKRIKLNLKVDNAAAVQLGQVGQTKNMRYLKKHQRVSEGFVKDALDDDDGGYRELVKVDSKKNKADQGTKDLSRQELEEHIKMCGMMTLKDFKNMSGMSSHDEDEPIIDEPPKPPWHNG